MPYLNRDQILDLVNKKHIYSDKLINKKEYIKLEKERHKQSQLVI